MEERLSIPRLLREAQSATPRLSKLVPSTVEEAVHTAVHIAVLFNASDINPSVRFTSCERVSPFCGTCLVLKRVVYGLSTSFANINTANHEASDQVAC